MHPVNDCRVRTSFGAIPQIVFQVPASLRCNYFVFAIYLKVRFVAVFAPGFFSMQPFSANPVFMGVVESWRGIVFDNTGDVLERDY